MRAHDDGYVLAVDLGTSGCKTALVSVTGRVAAWEYEPVPLHVLPGGGAEQDPEDWWRAFLATAGRLVARDLVPRAAIAGVCCSTQGEGTIAVDRAGRPLMNAVLWMDMRGARYLPRITAGPLMVAGYDVRKLARWVRLTGGLPSLTGKDPAGHMLLIRYEFPEVYERTDKFLNVLDYMNLRLTGRIVATPDSILTSWVTDNRDSAHVAYNAALLAGCGIDPDKFPSIIPCTSVVGPLLEDVAVQLGLGRNVKVVAGAIDTTASAIGAGAVADYKVELYVGTSSWIAAHVPFKKTDVVASMASVPCAIPGKYLMTIMQTTAGGNLAFLRDQILYRRDELGAIEPPPDAFAALDRAAARVPAGSNGLLYAPWIFGERAPIEDRTVRGAIFNLSLDNNREDLARAVLEGVALNTRRLMKPVEKFLGRRPEALNMAGGGANSNVWCQIFADVLNLPIHQVADPIQANARGAALIAAVGLGYTSFAELSGAVPCRAVYQPNPANHRMYDRLFEAFIKFYNCTRGIYRALNN